MQATRITILLATLLFLQGCVIAVNSGDWDDDWSKRQKQNAERLQALALGVGESAIREEFGEPDFTDAFVRDGDEFTVLYYRTHRRHHDGRTTRDETTPLVFVGGELVGWGDSAIDNATRRHTPLASSE